MLGRSEKRGAVDSTSWQLSWRWWSSVVQVAQWKAGCLLLRTLPPCIIWASHQCRREPEVQGSVGSINCCCCSHNNPGTHRRWILSCSFYLKLLRFGHSHLHSRHAQVPTHSKCQDSILFPDFLSFILKKTKLAGMMMMAAAFTLLT